MNKFIRFVTDIFFPNRCPICSEFIEWNKFICKNCDNSLVKFPEGICSKCGKFECYCNSIQYDRAVVCFEYTYKAKDGILSLKDGNKEFGYYLGNLLGEKILADNIIADAVIPVPMSRESYKKRRYNQALIIAEDIAKINSIPIISDAIYKNKSAVQHSLKKAERLKNTSAFFSGIRRLDNMKIILCDDVITTGSTLNKCAELLKNMGAAAVYVAVGTTTKLKKE